MRLGCLSLIILRKPLLISQNSVPQLLYSLNTLHQIERPLPLKINLFVYCGKSPLQSHEQAPHHSTSKISHWKYDPADRLWHLSDEGRRML